MAPSAVDDEHPDPRRTRRRRPGLPPKVVTTIGGVADATVEAVARPRRFDLARWAALAGFGAAFVLAVIGLVVLAAPFTTDTATRFDCGPAVFELLVPPDSAFSGPADASCTAASGRRVTGGSLAVVSAAAAAFMLDRWSRTPRRDADERWLAASSRRDRAGSRRRSRRPKVTAAPGGTVPAAGAGEPGGAGSPGG